MRQENNNHCILSYFTPHMTLQNLTLYSFAHPHRTPQIYKNRASASSVIKTALNAKVLCGKVHSIKLSL